MTRFLLVLAAAACAVAVAPGAARAAACGLPDVQPLHVEFSDGSVRFRNEVFRRSGLVLATNGVAGAKYLRDGGAQTVYWWMKLENLVGTPEAPADPAGVQASADQLFDHAVASSVCATPLIALNELHKPTFPLGWTPGQAQYRANVLALLQRLSERGARPFLLLPSNPFVEDDEAFWWQEVAKVADLVREVYFSAPKIHAQGVLVGSRTLRQKMRDSVLHLTEIGVAPDRIGLMLGFQSGGMYGRHGLQPREAWLRFVKLNALAARQVARELRVGTVWSWGWGTFNTAGADDDKPLAACVYLWSRDNGLCDAPAAAGPAFNTSLVEGQIVLEDGIQCRTGLGQLRTSTVDQASVLTRSRPLALTALFGRLVQRAYHGVPRAQVLRAEEEVIRERFGGSRHAYLNGIEARRLSLDFARDVLADELRLQAKPRAWAWLIARQTRALIRTTCVRDELPQPGDIRLADYVPFLKLAP